MACCRFIEDSNRLMEQRNEALKETGEQTRKQLKELIEEKAKLANELNEAHVALSDADRKYSALNRTSISLKSELQSTQVSLQCCSCSIH